MLFRWDRVVPCLAERCGIEYDGAWLPESSYFEFDLRKIKRLLGYETPRDVQSAVKIAKAMRRLRSRRRAGLPYCVRQVLDLENRADKNDPGATDYS